MRLYYSRALVAPRRDVLLVCGQWLGRSGAVRARVGVEGDGGEGRSTDGQAGDGRVLCGVGAAGRRHPTVASIFSGRY